MPKQCWTRHVQRFGAVAVVLAIVIGTAIVGSLVRARPVRADAANQAVIGMPFSGKWAFNVNVNPPYTDSNSSHPSVHTKYYGDLATDVYPTDPSKVTDANGVDLIPVTLQVTYPTSGITFYWVAVSNGTCGQRTVVGVKVNGTDVGSVYFEHLNNAVTSGPITNGMTVGNVHQWTVNGSVCNPGPHVHIELKNTTNYACWADHGNPGVTLNQGDNLGVLGSSNTAAQQACGSTPSASIPAVAPPPARPIPYVFNGALDIFVRSGSGEVVTEYWSGSSWSGWASLGGNMGSDPAVIQNGTALNLFARGASDNLIYTKYYDPNSGWTGWSGMGGPTMQGNPRVVQYNSRLYVFALGTDNHPYANDWTSGIGWSGFFTLNDNMAGDLVPLVYGSELDIFTRGTDNAIWKDTTFDGVNWTGFSSLGGTLAGNPSVIAYGTQMLVWANNAGGGIYQDTFNAGVGWGGWTWMGSTFNGDPFVMQYQSDMEVYDRASGDGTIWTRYWNNAGQYWSGWGQLANAAYLGSPTAIQYGSTELDVFTLGSDGKVYKDTWNGSSWGGFTAL